MEIESQAFSEIQPPAPAIVPAGGVLYKVDSSCSSFGELWRDTRSPLVLLAWVTKLLRVRIPGSVNDPNVESLRPFQIPFSEFPQDVRDRFEPKVKELQAFGFDSQQITSHRIVDLFNNSRSHWASVPRADGRAIARICLRTEGSRVPPKTHLYVEMLSELRDGSFLQTTGARSSMNAASGVILKRVLDGAPSQIWSSHQELMQQAKVPPVILPPGDATAMLESLDRHHAKTRDLHLHRGVFKAMSNLDQKNSLALNTSYAQSARGDGSYPEVLLEMERLQAGKSGWVGGLAILAISIILFAAAGAPGKSGASTGPSWEWIGLLLPILFIHEMGHFIAMRIFGYRNVRMFFIPLFGAAVSGQNYGAAGWKKVMVSLMGPLPGILLGVVLGIIGMVLHHPLLIRAGLLALVLNGFNLLPVLPFDGGRVVQNLLFCRHYALDMVFRIVTALLLIGGGMWSGDRIFAFLGFFMLMGIPLALRTGRTAAEMRREGFGPPPGDTTAIPPAVAQAIVARVAARFTNKKTKSNKIIAQQSLAVYETLCAQPPGWPATLGFCTLHFGAFVVALVFAALLTVANAGPLNFPSFSQLGKSAVQYPISIAEMRQAPIETNLSTRSGPPTTLIANFPKAATAEKAFNTLRPQLASGEVLQWFGHTLLLGIAPDDDEARRRWIATLEKQTNEVCVNTAELAAGHLAVTFNAPNEGSAIKLKEELDLYFGVPAAMNLTPPWLPQTSKSNEEMAGHRLARQTYLRLQGVGTLAFKDPRIAALGNQVAQANRHGDKTELKRLSQLQTDLFKENRDRELQQLRESVDGSIDTVLVEQYLKLSPENSLANAEELEDFGFTSAANQAMAARMGQLTLVKGKPVPPDMLYATTTGGSSRVGPILSLYWLQFVDVTTGAPEMIRWLTAQGCTRIKYNFAIPTH